MEAKREMGDGKHKTMRLLEFTVHQAAFIVL